MQQLKVGSTLQGDKYRIEKVLGQGGFGITYLAYQELLDRKVAIKEFFFKEYCERDEATSQVSLGTQTNKDMVERFMAKFVKEARTISQLEHPNIIRIFDVFKENNTAYYVMEYIEGESLGDMVNRRGRIPEEEALGYIRCVADALDYVHQKHINHLDVKPGNIMVRNSDQRVLLIDFGLSKQYDAGGNQTSTTPVGISHGYAPIEQYKQDGVQSFSPQTDIYSLGATLYKLLSGNTPPQPSDILNDGLPELPDFVSERTRRAVKEAMQLRKVDRPQEMKAFLECLFVQKEYEKEKARTDIQESKLEKTELNKVEPQNEETVFIEEKKEIPDTLLEYKIYEEKTEPKVVQIDTREEKKGNKYFGCLIAVLLVILFIAIATNSSSPSAEELYQEAAGYLDKSDYAKAIPLLEEASDMGNPDAQWALAWCYGTGNGVAKNETTAFQLSWKAATQGNAQAQNNVGWCYQYGNNVAKDLTKAVEWYRKSAEQGNDMAQYNLGQCYYWGEGVTKNYNEAVKWFMKSAEQGNVEAQNDLGACYENGNGTAKKDLVKAVKWYRKSAEQGYAIAQCNLGYCYLNGTGIDKNLSKAVEWFKKSAEQEHPNALFALGWCYYYGIGVEKDLGRAKELMTKAAELGVEEAKNFLKENPFKSQNMNSQRNEVDKSSNDPNTLYQKGLKLFSHHNQLPERKKAIPYFEKAANSGHIMAMYYLGYWYDGNGGDQNKAVEYWTKAADLGCVEAMRDLGRLYFRNKYHNNENKKKGYIWLEKAARLGDLQAQTDLGREYYLDKERQKALDWWMKAANSGYSSACVELATFYRGGYSMNETKDYREAIKWLEKAATANNEQQGIFYNKNDKSSVARLDLVDLYYKNEVVRNLNRAKFWCEILIKDGRKSQIKEEILNYFNL